MQDIRDACLFSPLPAIFGNDNSENLRATINVLLPQSKLIQLLTPLSQKDHYK